MPRLASSKRRKDGNAGEPRERAKAAKRKKNNSENDPFFLEADEAISSGEEEEQQHEAQDDREEEATETADEKRLRVARAYLNRIKANVRNAESDDYEGVEGVGREEDEGARDSLVAAKLQQQQLEDSGRQLRRLADRVVKPAEASEGRAVGRRHRQPVTAVVLTDDDRSAFAASKDGLIVQWDVESNSSWKFEWPLSEPSTSGGASSGQPKGKGKQKERGSRHLLALAVSSDGRYLTGGGYDRKVHLWDVRTRQHLQSFSGHRGSVGALAFRRDTHQLFSASDDRSIKIWSIDERAYLDSLFGHQSEVLALSCLRQERVLSAARDRTCRVWKVPDETQLVFRGHAASIDCCAFVTSNDFLSGSEDGAVALWSAVKKKPVHLVRNAHGPLSSQGGVQGASCEVATDESEDDEPAEAPCGARPHEASDRANGVGASNGVSELTSSVSSRGSGGAAESWVGSVAVCSSSDLAASGGGNGVVRLWGCQLDARRLRPLHSLPTKGFVNSLAFANSGRFLLAGTGQEPRLGRWGKIAGVRNGVVLHEIELSL